MRWELSKLGREKRYKKIIKRDMNLTLYYTLIAKIWKLSLIIKNKE